MDHAVTERIDTRNDSLKRKVSFLKQKMKEEMDPAWKDFFKKNPDKKEEDVWRRLEERLRSKQNLMSGMEVSLSLIIAKDEDKEAYALRRREKIAPLILKQRIWWEPVSEASSYRVYVSKDRTIFELDHFSWETTPGIISKLVIGKTELILPDEWPEFPTESGTYYIGITSRDDIGNQSDPLLLSGLFKFLAPSAPLRGGIEYL